MNEISNLSENRGSDFKGDENMFAKEFTEQEIEQNQKIEKVEKNELFEPEESELKSNPFA